MKYRQHSRLFFLIRKYRYLLGSLYALLYMNWFCYLEDTIVPGSRIHIMHCPADDLIPLLPVFIIPYLFWFAYVLGAIFYFGFHDPDEMTRLGISLSCGMTVCLLICTLFPNGTDVRIPAVPGTGICSRLLSLIQSADTTTNVFPSIHVCNSLIVNDALRHSRDFRDRPGSVALSGTAALLICLSTIFLKQHSLIDVAGAVVLARILDVTVYQGLPVSVPAKSGQKKKALA